MLVRLEPVVVCRFSVKRDGKEHRMVIADIVVGDLVHFGYGNAFPADGLVLEVGPLRALVAVGSRAVLASG